jgi:hypothetical protein
MPAPAARIEVIDSLESARTHPPTPFFGSVEMIGL